MENLIIVAAIGKNNELGLDNKLIWKIKEDLGFYRNITLYNNIIMGRKTFESMPPKALENRNVFVLSSKPLDKYYDINVFNNIDSLLEYIKSSEEKFIVVGGASVYAAFLPHVDTMYLTEIEEYAPADTFFPEIDYHEWGIEEELYRKDKEYSNTDDISYVRNKYVRRRVK